jgi:hypothetical protein
LVKNFGFWELVAAVRPMTDPQDWKIGRAPGRDIFQKFIDEAKKEIGALDRRDFGSP